MTTAAASTVAVAAPTQAAHQRLHQRVMEVAGLHRRVQLTEGAGRIVWWIGVPLLAVVLLQILVHLPFYLRALVIPAVVIALGWLTWKRLIVPMLERYSSTRAALLVEHGRPTLRTRLVSALECYSDLQRPHPHFDTSMVHALVQQTQSQTQSEDFRSVIDQRPARKALIIGGITLLAWIIAFAVAPSKILGALWSMGQAWSEVRNVAQAYSGARIAIDPLDQRAYLKGTSVTLRAHQEGFTDPSMQAMVRLQNSQDWSTAPVEVDAQGHAQYKLDNLSDNFEVYFTAGRIQSDKMSVIVTERPRIASLQVEYELPEYARRAPILQPRSDGNLETVFGSTLVLTVKANKTLASAVMTGSFIEKKENFSVGGEYARGIVRLDNPKWLLTADTVQETYKLKLVDEYGFTNDDEDRAYQLVVTKDQSPRIALVSLPHRSPADEPHVLEQNLTGLGAIVQASDDFGISRLTVHYRIEDLETGSLKREDTKELRFDMPRVDVPQLAMLRFSEIGAMAGDRIVFWAEAEDAYNLEPEKGPNKSRTPAFKIAVVTQEEMFSEVVYRDDWSTQWYDSLKVATLTKREIPPRLSPEREPAADVAKKLMDSPQSTDTLRGGDQRMIQEYFESLNVIRQR